MTRRRAALQNLPRLERLQVIEDEDVGLVAGGDRAKVPEPVILRRVDGRHHDRVLRPDPLLDGDSDHLVDVSPLDYEVRLTVIGAEHAAIGAVLLDQRQQVAQVSRGGCFTEHYPHAETPLLERLFEGGRLVVGTDAGGQVGVERGATHAGGVAIDMGGEMSVELGQLRFVTGDDPGEVHHLGHADGAVAAQEALDVAGGEGAPRRLESGRGHAGAGHHEDVQRQVRAAVEQPVDAIGAEHVGDLVRVGDHRGGAVGHYGAGELVDHELGRLDVHVGVDEAGDQVRARDVDLLSALIPAEPDHMAVLDRDVEVQPLFREHGEHMAAREHKVGRLVTACDSHPVRVDDGQA